MHREAITHIKYLINTKVFVSFCAENYFKVWKANHITKKVNVLADHKIKKEKLLQAVLPISLIDSVDLDRFLVVFKTGESEMFEFDSESEELWWIETEKTREHDCQLTGYDYCPQLKLIVTSDVSGVIRLWNRDKKFLKEIIFPTPIDAACFLNYKGDLLVSHA